MNQTKELIEQLKKDGISNLTVLDALAKVPREAFTLEADKHLAYANIALPFHCQQTISQPYIVALMTQCLYAHPQPRKILEIGTGSGYQSAILANLFDIVYSIERIQYLYETAKLKLTELGYNNVHCKWDDGYEGWADQAPFDGILVTACANDIPEALIAQLSDKDGVLVCPVKSSSAAQALMLVQKSGTKTKTKLVEHVSFVPLLRGTTDNSSNN